MSADGATTGQPGYPHLKSGREGWQPGKSGNPAGLSKYEYEVREAIRLQETPSRVCAVVNAMYQQALSGSKSAPGAAKVYAMLVGAEPNDGEKIIKAVSAHLDALMREAERLEAIETERVQAKLNPLPEETK